MVILCKTSGIKVLFVHVKIELDHKEALKHTYKMSHIYLDLDNLNLHQLAPLCSRRLFGHSGVFGLMKIFWHSAKFGVGQHLVELISLNKTLSLLWYSQGYLMYRTALYHKRDKNTVLT